jgi:hypothetical protein
VRSFPGGRYKPGCRGLPPFRTPFGSWQCAAFAEWWPRLRADGFGLPPPDADEPNFE